MYVQIKNSVLVVWIEPLPERKRKDIVINAVQALASQEKMVLKGSLGHFHRRFGHLNYVNVERMTADPINRIESGRTV